MKEVLKEYTALPVIVKWRYNLYRDEECRSRPLIGALRHTKNPFAVLFYFI